MSDFEQKMSKNERKLGKNARKISTYDTKFLKSVS